MGKPFKVYTMLPPHSAVVDVVGRPRRRLAHLPYHSQTGFGWGYGGSGPADLALALLANHLGELRGGSPSWYGTQAHYRRRIEATQAFRLHQPFKWEVVAAHPKDEGWILTTEDIAEWVSANDGKWSLPMALGAQGGGERG